MLHDLPQGLQLRELLRVHLRQVRVQVHHRTQDLHPLDRVDPQVRLHLHVQLEHLHRVARLLTDHLKHALGQRHNPGTGRSRGRNRFRLSCRGRFRRLGLHGDGCGRNSSDRNRRPPGRCGGAPRHKGGLLSQGFKRRTGNLGLASQILPVYPQGLSLMFVEAAHVSLQAFHHVRGRPFPHETRLLPHQVVEGASVLLLMIQILLMNLQGFPLMFEEEGQPLVQTLQRPLRFCRDFRSGRGRRRNASLRSLCRRGGGHGANGTPDLMTVVQGLQEGLLCLFAYVVCPGQFHGRRARAFRRADRLLRTVRIDVPQGQACNA